MKHFKSLIDLDKIAASEIELKNSLYSAQNTNDIDFQFNLIFKTYASNVDDIEAFKRGIFYIWYSRLEPNFLTGINVLDKTSLDLIINKAVEHLDKITYDFELDWMLSYYSNWDFLFEDYPEFHTLLIEKQFIERPVMDNNLMVNRDLMRSYFNELH
ncbi:hypothetical protein R1T16_09465 [Flavobacterium sp. DG1-102-2]|uniref:hypothetical protein n=1 Tax=Flavobacterium sp. DG1-102-2 TaxID=3081663 RepID=UPI0029492A85|nr:hypothetical protein [Flavobacterium sp. DG1-102-2]MDV6168651.1 hypothetical protein [Flavobacterium sp. DG1-102-2]